MPIWTLGPTAVFTSPSWAPAEIPESVQLQLTREVPIPEPLPIPEPDVPFPWGRLVVIGLIIGGLVAWRRQQAVPVPGGVVWVFGRLQRQAGYLGQPVRESETPTEFAERLQTRLGVFGRLGWLEEMVTQIQPQVRVLAGLFNGRQYGRQTGGDEVAVGMWRGLKRPLWLLRVVQWLKRP